MIAIPVRNLVEYLLDEIRGAVAMTEAAQLDVQLREIAIELACTSADGLPIAAVIELGDFSLGDDPPVSKASSQVLDRPVLVDADSLDAAFADTISRLCLRVVP